MHKHLHLKGFGSRHRRWNTLKAFLIYFWAIFSAVFWFLHVCVFCRSAVSHLYWAVWISEWLNSFLFSIPVHSVPASGSAYSSRAPWTIAHEFFKVRSGLLCCGFQMFFEAPAPKHLMYSEYACFWDAVDKQRWCSWQK